MPARSKARRSLASGESVSRPGSSRPDMASTTRLTAGSATVPAAVVADGRRREQAARHQERPADFLVGRDRDTGEALRCGKLGGSEQQARLADARLALEGHRGEATRRLVELLRDRVELGAAADDRAGRAAQLDRERALRLDEWVERAALASGRDVTRSGGIGTSSMRWIMNVARRTPLVAEEVATRAVVTLQDDHGARWRAHLHCALVDEHDHCRSGVDQLSFLLAT